MSYSDAWREDRRRWSHCLPWWAGGPLLIGLFTTAAWNVLARFMAPPDAKRWSDSLALAGGLMWAALLVYGFHCPRCGNLFYA